MNLSVNKNIKAKNMITHKGTMPHIIWWNSSVEEFEKKLHKNIVNEVLNGILEDSLYGIKDASIDHLYDGHFRIVALREDVDLEAVAEELKAIIEEYELEEY